MNETQEQIRPAAQASETAIQLLAHRVLVRRGGICKTGFDIPVAILFRVEFGRVFGQRLDDDFGMAPQVADGRFASVDWRMVANQDEAFWHETAQVLQGCDHGLAVHPAVKMPFVDLARQGQPDRCRAEPPIAGDPLDHRALTAWGPSAPEPFHKRVPEFIIKHDVYAESPRFF